MIYKNTYVYEKDLEVSNYEEVKDLIEEGLPFRVAGSDWIYKFEGEHKKGAFYAKAMNKQSVYARRNMLFKVVNVDDPEKKIFIGKEHEEFILKEVSSWVRDVNEKWKAYGGCDFKAYLRAIPLSMLSYADFLERVVETLDNSFATKLKYIRAVDSRERFKKMNEEAVKLVCDRVKENPEEIRKAPKQLSFFDMIDRSK